MVIHALLRSWLALVNMVWFIRTLWFWARGRFDLRTRGSFDLRTRGSFDLRTRGSFDLRTRGRFDLRQFFQFNLIHSSSSQSRFDRSSPLLSLSLLYRFYRKTFCVSLLLDKNTPSIVCELSFSFQLNWKQSIWYVITVTFLVSRTYESLEYTLIHLRPFVPHRIFS